MGNENRRESADEFFPPSRTERPASANAAPQIIPPVAPKKIVDAAESVQSLRRQLANALKGMSPFNVSDTADDRRKAELQKLPPRQRETMQRLLAGDGEKQIASRLKISAHTVHVYVKQLYVSYGVSSRGELLSVWLDARFDDKNGSNRLTDRTYALAAPSPMTFAIHVPFIPS